MTRGYCSCQPAPKYNRAKDRTIESIRYKILKFAMDGPYYLESTPCTSITLVPVHPSAVVLDAGTGYTEHHWEPTRWRAYLLNIYV